MLGRLGLKLFVLGLFAFIVVYHFFADVWRVTWFPYVLWGLMGVGFVLWFVFSIEWIITWIQKRSSQFGISLVVSAVGLLGILGVVNWGSIELQSINPDLFKKDLTRGKIHSLSEQTIKVLGSLKEDVTLEVWTYNVKDMSGAIDMKRLLDSYVQNSKGKLKLSVRNPNADRLEAIQAKVTRKDIIIAKSASGRESRIDSFTDTKAEEQITNAIIQSIKGSRKMICFLTGHGELDANSPQGQSISMWREALEASSYQLTDITLATEKTAPTQCEVIASVGPASSPSANEVKLLQEYLAQGGKLLAMWGFDTPLAWQEVLSPYGVKLENNILIDDRVQGAPAVFTKNYAPGSPLVEGFNQPLLLVLSRSIGLPAVAPAGVTVRPVLSVEDGTLLKEGDVKSLRGGVVSKKSLESARNKAVVVEIKKPIAEATKASTTPGDSSDSTEAKSTKETQILVLGNHMVASNGLITQFGNSDFLLNSMSYLLRDTDLIGIRPREIKSAKIELNRERLNQVQGYLLLSTLAFIVAAFFAAFGRRTQLA